VPFTQDGRLDDEAFADVLRLYLSESVHGVLVNGTTGEWTAQTPAERRRVAEIAGHVMGPSGTPWVVGVSAFRLADSRELAVHALASGAHGLLATVPPYTHPSEHESVSFFAELTSAVAAPWMVYNWPRGTSVDHSVEALDKIADLDNVAAIKDSTGDELKAARGCERLVDRVRFFARFIHRQGYAVMREFGGDGNIDGGGLGARWAVPFYESHWAHDVATARVASARYESLTRHLVNADYSTKFGSPIPQLKAAMRLLGQPGGYVRSPFIDITDEGVLARLREALEEAGLHPQ
jgi:4-hydroxy-tetrahydrodipicolinate synthase